MKGLLYKDFKFVLQSISPAYLMCLVPIMVYLGKDEFLYMFAVIIGLMSGMQILFTISNDERVKFTHYYRILPLSYHVIALEKYIFMFFLSLLAGIMIFFVTFCYTREFSYMYPLIGAYIAIIYGIIMIPSSLYFGVEKGRYVLMLLAVLPMFMAKFKEVLLKILPIISKNFIAIAIFFHIILLAFSYMISVKSVKRYPS